MWRGDIGLGPGLVVPLSIVGKRSRPDSDALDAACSVVGHFAEWRPLIEAALGQHAADMGVEPDAVPPPSYAAVIAIDGLLTIEFGYDVPWDEEHTLGVCVRDNEVVELNGSVLPL